MVAGVNMISNGLPLTGIEYLYVFKTLVLAIKLALINKSIVLADSIGLRVKLGFIITKIGVKTVR